jgi:hydroxypyruvate isomerase
MNRRTFTRAAGGVLAGSMLPLRATVAGASSAPVAKGKGAGVPFSLSVMLWTILRDLPFEQRLEKVAAAGYTNVELVGEY